MSRIYEIMNHQTNKKMRNLPQHDHDFNSMIQRFSSSATHNHHELTTRNKLRENGRLNITEVDQESQGIKLDGGKVLPLLNTLRLGSVERPRPGPLGIERKKLKLQENMFSNEDGSPKKSALLDWSYRKQGPALFHRVVDFDHTFLKDERRQWRNTGFQQNPDLTTCQTPISRQGQQIFNKLDQNQFKNSRKGKRQYSITHKLQCERNDQSKDNLFGRIDQKFDRKINVGKRQLMKSMNGKTVHARQSPDPFDHIKSIEAVGQATTYSRFYESKQNLHDEDEKPKSRGHPDWNYKNNHPDLDAKTISAHAPKLFPQSVRNRDSIDMRTLNTICTPAGKPNQVDGIISWANTGFTKKVFHKKKDPIVDWTEDYLHRYCK